MREPLSTTERAALTLWVPVLAGLGLLVFLRRGHGTLSECGRLLRRRITPRGWALGWGVFAYWFWRHIMED